VEEVVAHAGLRAPLSSFGVTREAIPALAEEAARQWTATFNPRTITAEDHVPAPAAGATGNVGRRGPEYGHSASRTGGDGQDGCRCAQTIGHGGGLVFGRQVVRQPNGQLDQAPERRRAETAADFKLGVVERSGIACGNGLDGGMIGLICLDDRQPRDVAAAGPTHGLHQQLVRPLGRPFVRQVEGDVGRDHAHQGHLGDVQALRDETRAHENVKSALGEGVEDTFDRALVLGDIAIEAADTKPRECGFDLFLDALRAAAQVPNPGRTADRAA